jgi:hypothetical protein
MVTVLLRDLEEALIVPRFKILLGDSLSSSFGLEEEEDSSRTLMGNSLRKACIGDGIMVRMDGWSLKKRPMNTTL